MLERGDNSAWFKTVDSDALEFGIPIKGVEIEQTSAVEHGSHASMDFRGAEVVIAISRTILTG